MPNSFRHPVPLGPTSREPIDVTHLLQQTAGDRGVLIEVLTLYCTMAPRYLAKIENSDSLTVLAEGLHTLKSAAAGIGAWLVQERVRDIEMALAAGQTLDPEWIDDLSVAVAEGVRFAGLLLEGKRGLLPL